MFSCRGGTFSAEEQEGAIPCLVFLSRKRNGIFLDEKTPSSLPVLKDFEDLFISKGYRIPQRTKPREKPQGSTTIIYTGMALFVTEEEVPHNGKEVKIPAPYPLSAYEAVSCELETEEFGCSFWTNFLSSLLPDNEEGVYINGEEWESGLVIPNFPLEELEKLDQWYERYRHVNFHSTSVDWETFRTVPFDDRPFLEELLPVEKNLPVYFPYLSHELSFSKWKDILLYGIVEGSLAEEAERKLPEITDGKKYLAELAQVKVNIPPLPPPPPKK